MLCLYSGFERTCHISLVRNTFIQFNILCSDVRQLRVGHKYLDITPKSPWWASPSNFNLNRFDTICRVHYLQVYIPSGLSVANLVANLWQWMGYLLLYLVGEGIRFLPHLIFFPSLSKIIILLMLIHVIFIVFIHSFTHFNLPRQIMHMLTPPMNEDQKHEHFSGTNHRHIYFMHTLTLCHYIFIHSRI